MINLESKSVNTSTYSTTAETGNIINICYASSNNYAKYLALSMATVLMSKAPDDKINFYILDGGLTEKDRENILDLKKIAVCEIEFIAINNEKFASCPINTAKYLSVVAYYRLSLPDVLKDLDKVLSI